MEERRVNRIQLLLIFGTGFPHNLSNMGVRGKPGQSYTSHSQTGFCTFSIAESVFWWRAEPLQKDKNDLSSPLYHILVCSMK